MSFKLLMILFKGKYLSTLTKKFLPDKRQPSWYRPVNFLKELYQQEPKKNVHGHICVQYAEILQIMAFLSQ